MALVIKAAVATIKEFNCCNSELKTRADATG